MGIDAVMLVTVAPKPNHLTEEEAIDLAYWLGATFGNIHFYTSRQPPVRTLEIAKDHVRSWIPKIKHDDQLLEINLNIRYYGETYTRGPGLVVCAIGDWLERNIKGSRIYYGSDSNDWVPPFDKAQRIALYEHFLRVGYAPYYSSKPSALYPNSKPHPCPVCNGRSMQRTGSSPTGIFWRCLGCGTKAITNPETDELVKYLKRYERWE